jgi:nitroreductase
VHAHTATLHELPEVGLPGHDPMGRDRLISCGAALTNLEYAVRVLGWSEEHELFPPDAGPTAVGRITAGHRKPPSEREIADGAAILWRHSYRRSFRPNPVPAEEITHLLDTTDHSGVVVYRAGGSADAVALAELLSYATRVLREDHSYQRELAAWTVGVGQRGPDGRLTGIPETALSEQALPAAGLVRHGTPVPDPAVLAARIAAERVLILTTVDDARLDHVRSGMALQRLWLNAISRGMVASTVTQPLHLSEVRTRLRRRLALPGIPHVLLRIGYPAAATSTPG